MGHMPHKTKCLTVLDVVRPSIFVAALLAYAGASWLSACVPRSVPGPDGAPEAWAPDVLPRDVFTRDLPSEPFPGQKQATDGKCGTRQVPLRHPGGRFTGCWKRLADPPSGKEGCGEDFEWLGYCYAPVLQGKRAPSTVEP